MPSYEHDNYLPPKVTPDAYDSNLQTVLELAETDEQRVSLMTIPAQLALFMAGKSEAIANVAFAQGVFVRNTLRSSKAPQYEEATAAKLPVYMARPVGSTTVLKIGACSKGVIATVEEIHADYRVGHIPLASVHLPSGNAPLVGQHELPPELRTQFNWYDSTAARSMANYTGEHQVIYPFHPDYNVPENVQQHVRNVRGIAQLLVGFARPNI